jgi:uncharacterized protein with beta-barrel porin domain
VRHDHYTHPTTPTALSITLVPNFDFAGVGATLTTDEESVSNDLQQLATATVASATPSIIAAIYEDVTSFRQYQTALEDLGAHAYSELGVTRSTEERAFADAMTTCHSPTGGARAAIETNCLWGRASGGIVDRDASEGAQSFNLRTTRFEFGGQTQMGAGWFVGGGLAYADTHLGESAGLAEIFHTGAFVKYQTGRLTFSLAVTGSKGWYDSYRAIVVGKLIAEVHGSPRLEVLGGFASAAYDLAVGRSAYIRPKLDVGVIYIHADDFIEHGPSSLSASLPGSRPPFRRNPRSSWGATGDSAEPPGCCLISVSAAAFTVIATGPRTRRSPIMRSLLTHLRTELASPGETGRVGGGVELRTVGGVSVSLDYEGELARGYAANTGSLRATASF